MVRGVNIIVDGKDTYCENGETITSNTTFADVQVNGVSVGFVTGGRPDYIVCEGVQWGDYEIISHHQSFDAAIRNARQYFSPQRGASKDSGE